MPDKYLLMLQYFCDTISRSRSNFAFIEARQKDCATIFTVAFLGLLFASFIETRFVFSSIPFIFYFSSQQSSVGTCNQQSLTGFMCEKCASQAATIAVKNTRVNW